MAGLGLARQRAADALGFGDSADQEASYNLAGAKSPAIDALIAAMQAAPTEEDFVAAARALDRVLLSGFLSFRCTTTATNGSPTGGGSPILTSCRAMGSRCLATFWKPGVAHKVE